MGLTLGEQHRTGGLRGHGVEQRYAVARSHRRELVRCPAGVGQLVRGETDLDIRRQQPWPIGCVGLVHRPPDAGECRTGPALGEPEQRQPRLCLVPVATSLDIGFLGGDQLATQPMDLTAFVRRHPGGPLSRWVREPETGRRDELHGGTPRTVELEDLRPVHQTLSVERDQLRL